jgi:heparin/heparan-sulfate lyase
MRLLPLALAGLLLTVAAAPQARQPPSPAPAHPRMLVSASDPFTGLDVLRARYASGRRPSNDACGEALTWLLTGDEAFAERAVQRLRDEPAPARPGSRTYPAYVCRALAFDWLYEYSGFDAALKDRVAGELAQAAERMLQDASLREPDAVSYQNYPVRFLALADFASAAVANHPSVAARMAPVRDRIRRSFDNILRTAELVTPTGGFHESMDYMRITMAPMAMMAELRRTGDGDDPAWQYGLFQNIIRTYLYKVLPDGSSSREGDDEYPLRQSDDNTVLAYAVSRFKDPYAAWMLRESGWCPPEWRVPVLQFLWSDDRVAARDPRKATPNELPRHHWFRGLDHVVFRDGWDTGSTWIQFLAGPFTAKHQHLDRNAFTIYHGGYLAIDSGADYTDTESPHYLNYYRRTVAHNTMLVYQPGETFFWGEDLWRAANDGGQRMDSSRYWNTIRSVDDWQRTRDLWDVARVEAASFHDGDYQYVRGNATNAYAASKVSLFTRELLYVPARGLLAIFDRVRSAAPDLKKVWLLHGVDRPQVEAPSAGTDSGHGGMSYGAATTVTWQDGTGSLRVHPLLPRGRNVTIRGGDGWEFWTPGDEHGGAWGSGRNWPLEPWDGGPLPDDPYLVRMWKTFWGDDFTHLARSNKKGVVPGNWRMEVTPSQPSADDRFLHVLEIGDRGAAGARRVEVLDGELLSGALVDDLVVLFARDERPADNGEITLPSAEVHTLLVAGLCPGTTYELQWTTLGIPKGAVTARTDEAGVLKVDLQGAPAERLRLYVVNRR